MSEDVRRLRPQPGPQTQFASTRADIAIYGGAAGGGKSWSILADAARYTRVPGFSAVMFRRTFPQLTQEGGLWPESQELYLALGGIPNASTHTWRFSTQTREAVVAMRHLQHEKDKHSHQGAQYAGIYFDELTHFTEGMWWYMFSRNRSLCGVRPYMRAGTNPDPDSWVRAFVDWWIDDDGFPDPEKAGKLRWFRRVSGRLQWYDEPTEGAVSATFIPARLEDNQILERSDPGYRARLEALTDVDRAQLLAGNWNVRHEGSAFQAWHLAGLEEASSVQSGTVIVSMDPGGNKGGNPAGIVVLCVRVDDQGRVAAEVLHSEHWWGVSTDRMQLLNHYVTQYRADFVCLDNDDRQLIDAAKARYGASRVLHAAGTDARVWQWYSGQLLPLMANVRLRVVGEHGALMEDLRRLKLDGQRVILPVYRGPDHEGQNVPIHCDAADALLRAMQAIGVATASRGSVHAGVVEGAVHEDLAAPTYIDDSW